VKISLSRLHYPVTTLGPGRRIGIWFQGCSIRCDGCVSADTWAEGRTSTTVAEVANAVARWLPEADGITLSGGEPFDQPEALAALLAEIPLADDQDVLAYSGHPFERIAHHPSLMNRKIDALISDPYLAEEAQTLPLRGSDNQRLHLLTELGRKRFSGFQVPVAADRRSLDVMFDSDGTVWLAGIPRPGDMDRLRHILSTQGHDIHTTAAPIRTR
jgi:anaerobic ribonucleoside-triphosphate reductase activating protein